MCKGYREIAGSTVYIQYRCTLRTKQGISRDNIIVRKEVNNAAEIPRQNIYRNPTQPLQCRSVESYLPALKDNNKKETKEIKACVRQSLSPQHTDFAYFDLHFLLRSTKAGQTKLGTCSRSSTDKLRQCRFEKICFCLVEASFVLTDPQHSPYSRSRASRT